MASPAVAVIVKKAVVVVATDKKLRKIVLGIILGALIIIMLPIAVVMGLANQEIEIDVDRAQELIVENMSYEDREMLLSIENTMNAIDDAMTDAGHSPSRVTEAQVLYILALSEQSTTDNFVERLVNCFSLDQSDENLISRVNSTFGTNIVAQDFSNVMLGIRGTYIDTTDYVDPSRKNNIDLAKWAENAADKQWGYVFGTYGTVLSEEMLRTKMNQYPGDVAVYEEFIRENWLGRRTADCVGLIKGYGWFNTASQEIEIGANGMPDIGSDGMYANATEKGPINTIPEIPGLAVWHAGHIGIYIGDGKVVEAMTTTVGVVVTDVFSRSWTHWLKIPYIDYIEDGDD
ncbi:MAG: hypothetical protein IJO20_08660 [Ruminococcus sp.]|nr:hypothetical protein [Ruminococcus sp.]